MSLRWLLARFLQATRVGTQCHGMGWMEWIDQGAGSKEFHRDLAISVETRPGGLLRATTKDLPKPKRTLQK